MKKYIMIMLLAVCSPAYAEEANFVCEATVDNKVYINGDCLVQFDKEDVEIYSEPNPKRGHYGTFIFIYRNEGKITATWNEGGSSHAQAELGELVEQSVEGGMCYYNQRAKLCYVD